jgi:Peptidase family M48
MIIVLLASATALLALPCVARQYGRRLAPDHWARLVWAALATGVTALESGLVLLALPTVLRAVGVPQLAEACNMVLGHLALGPAPVGWLAAALAVVLPARAAVVWWGTRGTASALTIEGALGRHHAFRGHELVVLPTTRVLAYSVRSDERSQIVISQGVVDQLTADELTAVLAHEDAHLRYAHQQRLVIAALLEGTLAPMRRCTAELRLALERWADEEAAARSGRPIVRRALMSLLEPLLTAQAVPAFTTADTVVERIDALELPPPTAPSHALLLTRATVVVLIACALAAATGWLFDASRMLGFA